MGGKGIVIFKPLWVIYSLENIKAISMYSVVVGFVLIQWNLSWNTTAMRDHLSWRTTYSWQKVLHFNAIEPVSEDHLSWETIFLWPMRQSFKTGSTVHPIFLVWRISLFSPATGIYNLHVQWSLYFKTFHLARKCAFKWKLSTEGIYIENVGVVLVIGGLKIEGNLNIKGLKS